MIANDAAYLYVAHPKLPFAYRADVWDPASIVEARASASRTSGPGSGPRR